MLDRGGTNGNPYGGLGVNLGNDQIGGLWTGFIHVDEAGDYAFTTRSDDGSRVWVDVNGDGQFDASELMADLPGHGGMRNNSTGAVHLDPGYYMIKAATFEGGGGAGMQVSWQQNTGDTTFSRQIIGPDVLGMYYQSDNSLVKEGTGTLTLTGDNTYNGTTTVSEGTLLVNGTHTGGAAYTVNGTGTLGGYGTIGSPVTIADDGTLAPGNTPGILTLTNGLTFTGGTFEVEIEGTTAGTEYDQVVVTGGDVELGLGVADLSLIVDSGYNPGIADYLWIIDNTGGERRQAISRACPTVVPSSSTVGGSTSTTTPTTIPQRCWAATTLY